MSYSHGMFLGLVGAATVAIAMQSDTEAEPSYSPTYVNSVDYGPLPQTAALPVAQPPLDEWTLPDSELSALRVAARQSQPRTYAPPKTDETIARFEKLQAQTSKVVGVTNRAAKAVDASRQQAAIKAAQAKVDHFQKLAKQATASRKKMDDQIARVTKLGKSVTPKDLKTLDQRNREHRAAIEAVNRGAQASASTIASAKQALRSL